MIPTEAVPLNAEVKPGGFGKYLLLEKIGEGVMAQLHRATTTDVHGAEKILAIKRILPHLSGERDLAKAFLDEAKLTALLNHENIVRIYDSGQVKSSYFIAMEYLSGKDLKQIFDESREKGLPFGFEDALFITSQICSGLDYAHKLTDSQGEPLHILHRDISPQNILITHEGRVKIVDFGIVRAASKCTVTKHEMLKKRWPICLRNRLWERRSIPAPISFVPGSSSMKWSRIKKCITVLPCRFWLRCERQNLSRPKPP